MRKRTIAASSLLMTLLAVASPAHAQQLTAAIMPATAGHREVPPEPKQAAQRAALELLRSEDLLVIEPGDLLLSLNEEQQLCAPGAACATEIRSTLGVDLLVGLTIWGTSSDPSNPQVVHASILDAMNARYVGTANVEQSVATAARDALRAALRDQRRGPGPFLQVEGTRGATCELDGEAVGTVPLTVRVDPGEHELLVYLDHFVTQTVNVSISADAAHTTEVEVTLRSETGSSSGATTTPDVTANLLLAGSFGAAGILLAAIHPLPTLARDGECVDSGPRSPCIERVSFDAGAATLLGIGSALLVVGIVIAITQPITMSVSASSDSAYLEIQGSF